MAASELCCSKHRSTHDGLTGCRRAAERRGGAEGGGGSAPERTGSSRRGAPGPKCEGWQSHRQTASWCCPSLHAHNKHLAELHIQTAFLTNCQSYTDELCFSCKVSLQKTKAQPSSGIVSKEG